MKQPATLVFLHGLLGDSREWMPIVSQLPGYEICLLTLPGHECNCGAIPRNFSAMNRWLTQTLVDAGIGRYWLVGYSLGGRLAAYHAFHSTAPAGLKGLVLEGVHPGLITESDKSSRWTSDNHWANLFKEATMEIALRHWYLQPLFSDLSPEQRAFFIALRNHQQGPKIAQMLLALSLAKQPYFGLHMQQYAKPLYYICGERDRRFQTMAQLLKLNLTRIQAAGHNTHIANPTAFAAAVSNALQRS